MGKASSKALISLFLLAEMVVPYTAFAYWEYFPVFDSFSYFKRIFELATTSDHIFSGGEEISEVKPLHAKAESISVTAVVTAYSSSPDETDDDPFITAAGTAVRDGIIATNMLPFGTKVRIPELFGDRIFVVEDRMHQRFRDRIDIWFSSKKGAREFGKRIAHIEIES